MSKIGKALLSTAMIAATAATFASTTYAFVVLEKEAHVDDIQFEIETHEGLLVSLDADTYVTAEGEDADIKDLANIADNKLKAKNFYQDISKEMLEPHITGTVYQGVTMVAGEATEITCKDELLADVKTGVTFDTLGNLKFQKDSLVAKEPTESNPYRSDHKLVDADASDYIKLDLSFRLAHQGETNKTYKLVFTTSSITSAKGEDSLELMNSLFTVGKNPAREKDGTEAVGNAQNEWRAGETLTVNPVDALRIAVVNRDTYISELTSGDVNKSLTVLESKNGLGSAAIEGFEKEEHAGKGSVYDKTLNAMYTYHNNVHPFEKFTKAAAPHIGFDTVKVDFANFQVAETSESYVLGTFTPGDAADEHTKASYDDLHLSLYIYLEGWDADFFTGISHESSNFNVKLGFEIQEVA